MALVAANTLAALALVAQVPVHYHLLLQEPRITCRLEALELLLLAAMVVAAEAAVPMAEAA